MHFWAIIWAILGLGMGFFGIQGDFWLIGYLVNITLITPLVWGTVMMLGWKKAVVSTLLIGVLAIFVESLGLLTGWPYGEFRYLPGIGPLWQNFLPYILPISFLPLFLSAWTLSWLCQRPATIWLWMLILDLMLDPMAVHLGLWVYAEEGWYLGVPLSNFLGWMISGVVMNLVWWRLTRKSLKVSRKASEMLINGTSGFVALWTSAAAVVTWKTANWWFLLPVAIGASLLIFLNWQKQQRNAIFSKE